MHLIVSNAHIDPLQGPKDEYIMQDQHLQRYSQSQQLDLNLVRMWLQVATLADLRDTGRPNRIRLCYLDAQQPPNFASSTLWPRQEAPTKSQQRLWKRFISSSYLSYIPYWKVTPLLNVTTCKAAPTVPPTPTDITSYISFSLSKTEKRLLDGLHQQATD